MEVGGQTAASGPRSQTLWQTSVSMVTIYSSGGVAPDALSDLSVRQWPCTRTHTLSEYSGCFVPVCPVYPESSGSAEADPVDLGSDWL